MELRPYQSESIDALYAHLRMHDNNPCIVIPVGGGKTVVMAELIREALTKWPGTRIAIIAHVRELVEQNADKLARHWPEAQIGIFSASLKRRDRFQPIIFASIQSVYDKAQTLGHFDLLLIDEAHRIPLRAEGMYRKFIDACKQSNPNLRLIGLTATPYRLGSGPVCGPDYMLNAVCYEVKLADLIRDGYLCKLISKGGIARADLSDVHIRGGEYVADELNAAVNSHDLVNRACDEIIELCRDRKAWIVFCASVDHTKAVRDALAERGIAVAMVEGNTPTNERTLTIEAFQRGDLQALCNVNVLCEGFDCPRVDAIIMLRPTKSPGLYVQQVGRGTRLFEGKTDCLVLDFAGNIAEHGPVDSIEVKAPSKRGGKAEVRGIPVKECPDCHSFVPIQTTECVCGYRWTRAAAKHDGTASFDDILSNGKTKSNVFLCKVTAISYGIHRKPDKPPSLCVTYSCGLRSFREWLCFEHGGIPRLKAVNWWKKRTTRHTPAPTTIVQAVENAFLLEEPIKILVVESGKYPEIVGYEFQQSEVAEAA